MAAAWHRGKFLPLFERFSPRIPLYKLSGIILAYPYIAKNFKN